MKNHFNTIKITAIAIISGSLFLTACSGNEEDASGEQEVEKVEKEAPKSKKGNWTEADATKFMTDVSSSVPANIQSLGEDAVKEILSCYLNKAVLNYESYDDANNNKLECSKLANDCLKELVKAEDLYDILPEESISEEKVQEITGDVEKMLNEQLPK